MFLFSSFYFIFIFVSTFGYAVRHILEAFCDSDVSTFKSVKVRFAKPVLPGQTIQTNMWLEKESKKVYFECKVVETNTVVINGAYAELHSLTIPKVVITNEKNDSTSIGFASDKIFDELNLKLNSDPNIVKSVNAVYEFNITKGDSSKVFGKKNF